MDHVACRTSRRFVHVVRDAKYTVKVSFNGKRCRSLLSDERKVEQQQSGKPDAESEGDISGNCLLKLRIIAEPGSGTDEQTDKDSQWQFAVSIENQRGN